MPIDINAMLDSLDKYRKENPEYITYCYQKMFGIPEGQMVLIDLMDRFFEFKKPESMEQVGSQAVVIHIKNNILGVVDDTYYQPKKEEIPNAE